VRRIVLVALALAAALVGMGAVAGHLPFGARSEAAVVEEKPPPAPQRTVEPMVVVDVAGAVAHPGVYRLQPGARIADALLAAGGMTGEADLFALNKAAPIRDGARIYVPRPGETPPAASAGSESERKVDINHASASEIEALPGIGPQTAGRIVRSRNARAFARIEELQTRGLVTPRIFADIRDLITTR
jgi:competence protein ComEA